MSILFAIEEEYRASLFLLEYSILKIRNEGFCTAFMFFLALQQLGVYLPFELNLNTFPFYLERPKEMLVANQHFLNYAH